MNNVEFDWSDLAFGNKKALPSRRSTFIAAPRELSKKRFTELVKTYLPKGNIILGLAKEDYVLGFESQPQFQMLQQNTVQAVIDKVNNSPVKYKIYTLRYFQRETTYILDALRFEKIVFVNGSWKYVFHAHDFFYTIAKHHLAYELVSPFISEHEARQAETAYSKEIAKRHASSVQKVGAILTETGMLKASSEIAFFSFDHSFQTGITLGKKVKSKKNAYTLLAAAFNKVVPYQTYAMHYGSLRERNFSPSNDLNHYDTIHAEAALLVNANKLNIDLNGTAIFINLMHCPTCARMLSETNIDEFVYVHDHSNGYAVKMLEAAGKSVRRVVI